MLMWQLDVQICEAFSANRYPFPEEPSRQRQMNAEGTARLRELQTTIEAGAPPPENPIFCIEPHCEITPLEWT